MATARTAICHVKTASLQRQFRTETNTNKMTTCQVKTAIIICQKQNSFYLCNRSIQITIPFAGHQFYNFGFKSIPHSIRRLVCFIPKNAENRTLKYWRASKPAAATRDDVVRWTTNINNLLVGRRQNHLFPANGQAEF